ncbi:hypothetical protein ACHAWT_008487 [Skeletonema menzelii]
MMNLPKPAMPLLLIQLLLLPPLFSSAVVAQDPYHTLSSSDLPPANSAAARPSHLKGFLTSPEWHTGGYTNPQYFNTIESTMEFYYIGLSDVMTGMNAFPGFDSVVEPRVAASASRGKHSILRFYMDYPQSDVDSYVSHTPQFLKEAPYNVQMTDWSSADLNAVGSSPDYSDSNLINALENFVTALADRYDGDNRIGYIQLGLLGFWGEWHSWTGDSSTESWIPDETKMALIDAFDTAFQTTQVQTRYAHWYAFGTNQRQGFGLHDDSFAHSTIDEGVYGDPMSWFFWPQVNSLEATDFWKNGAMGGEVRPELQSTIFDTDYPAGTQYHQEFGVCADTTHATYMMNYYAFGVGYQGSSLESARAASDQMGYAFRLTEVSVAEGTVSGTVDITATVIQDGLAPFYYDLSLSLSCPGFNANLAGVDDIALEGSTASFTFTAVPATTDCLSVLEFSLSSSYALAGAPVKFAQGVEDGTGVGVSLPLPPSEAPPTSQPTSPPTTAVLTPSPTSAPVTGVPTSQPTNVLTPPPTNAPETASPTSPPSPNPTPLPSNAPTPPPTTATPTNPPAPSGLKTVVCGRGSPCSEGNKKTVSVDELHEVRCCVNAPNGLPRWWKQKCLDHPEFGDKDLYARSKFSGVCYNEQTFSQAKAVCSEKGARLCTIKEMEAQCAKGTGCNFDREMVWACGHAGYTCSADSECCGSCVDGTCQGE